ncbi:MAG: hypothetical protein KJ067_23340 [Vicinamibacteria bacterium]|nr:hypothetical protein [Vicinamibacteria bacterium]
MGAPLSLRARREIELRQIRLEITALGQDQLGQALTARDLAEGALQRSLAYTTVEGLLAVHVAALAARGVHPRREAIATAHAHLRRLLGRRRSNHPTTPEACR